MPIDVDISMSKYHGKHMLRPLPDEDPEDRDNADGDQALHDRVQDAAIPIHTNHSAIAM